ncbi:MBL fold metallo-hydrolase [Pelagibacterium halotolerans]|uniref:Putative hydrolase n=1 Tax=Pelagibacterium halotolerans (strain DSM 22347 / JCM 15775 / CGMCC 1.7692 / B2) TaxID=1082931 RepID=G4R814_PELHB|nr:MBL fold metallo-hydrolase [Pelagibacterium halotolerans]AEQ51292.1 putative hydrolase [Pelagibacterium halotolerans B2]QJR18851.1 MBL fold metallo-hydrolase [Pelagibacterium halotolerans]SEA66292.1 Ribonuclease BN, tRNA processing enzyme [Pelagibacterium halotolerans]
MTDASAVRWHTLGTLGGPFVKAGQAQICNALTVGDNTYLFDVGQGVRGQMHRSGLKESSIKAVFLTHHHVDHNADLGAVLISRWLADHDTPIPVYGPRGTEHLVRGLLDANRATEWASFPVSGPAKTPLIACASVKDLPDDLKMPTVVYEDGLVSIEAVAVDHYQVPPSAAPVEVPVSVGYRIRAGGRIIAFTGDSGMTPTLVPLASNADLFICEVIDIASVEPVIRAMMKERPAILVEKLLDNLAKNHLSPDEIGQVAAQAGVGQVVLTHYIPSFEDQTDLSNFTAGIERHFDGKISLARDCDVFEA